MDYKKITINSYDQNAESFSEKFKGLMQGRDEFQKFISLLKGKKILDLGCGSGDHSLYFKEKGFEVVPLDLSESMIELCKNRGLNPVLMDIEELNFGSNAFDGIWSVTSLLHVPKERLTSVILKLNSILKDGGVLYVCVKEGEGEGLIEDKIGDTKRFFSFWQEEDLIDLFKDSFNLIESEKKKLGNTTFLQMFFNKI
jgi:ubiquinone/menaquinone biosynthesis C-methylase UbiE